MELSIELTNFLKEYSEYETNILKPTLHEINDCLKDMAKPEFWNKYMTGIGVATPSPIRQIMHRIKQPEKVVEKIFRKPELFSDKLSANSLKKMHDTIGIRIIVYFSSQLSLIDRELRNSTFFEIDDSYPPKAYFEPEELIRLGLSHIEHKQKDSGYTSIHYKVWLKESSVHIKERPVFEIQVRTLAQELWCELEHVLSYKSETRPNLSAKRRFQILSRDVSVIDEHFNLLYEELIHNQEIIQYKDADILTFENTPKVLSAIGIQCALIELNPILKTLFSREIRTVGEFLKIVTPLRLTTIRNSYISITGRVPNNVELLSTLSDLKNVESKDIENERIQAHIHFQNLNSDQKLN
jgi:putative GTP pyrophosphokinase